MGITIGRRGGASGGGLLTLPSEFIFTDSIERDDYFSSNPSKLKDDMHVSVGGSLQKYIEQTWVDTSAVIKGQKGDSANNLMIQYSSTGDSGWSGTINLALHKYWRWSLDGGSTWSPNYVKFSGEGGGTGVPLPYSMIVGNNGKLQLHKDGALIQEQDETGSWVANSVSTGTGSFHLGSLHSIGSANENVIFKNEDSGLAWYPCWGAISSDGAQVIEQTARYHYPSVQLTTPAGTKGTNVVDCNITFTPTDNIAVLYLTITPREDYQGELIVLVTKASNGKEVIKFEYGADYTTWVDGRVPLKYPLWASGGQQLIITVTKPDGSFLQITSNQDGTQPYHEVYYRLFVDELVFHNGNAGQQAIALNALIGTDRISSAAIRDFPTMSPTVSGMARLGATMSISGSGELNTAISPTGIKIVADEPAMLAIPVSGGAILAIQQDSGFTYGIEAGEDTSVVGNWKQIGTVATDVVSFNGRNGAVVPANGDYNMDQVSLADQTTAAKYVFRVNNGVPYIEEIA